LTVCNNLCPVDIQRRTTDLPTFQFRSAHAGSNSLDDKTFFKLGNRTDNNDYRPAQWASRVDIFAQADELDAEMSQLVEQEVANASRYPVERGYEHDVETMSPSIC
jgi:hypothetical protein